MGKVKAVFAAACESLGRISCEVRPCFISLQPGSSSFWMCSFLSTASSSAAAPLWLFTSITLLKTRSPVSTAISLNGLGYKLFCCILPPEGYMQHQSYSRKSGEMHAFIPFCGETRGNKPGSACNVMYACNKIVWDFGRISTECVHMQQAPLGSTQFLIMIIFFFIQFNAPPLCLETIFTNVQAIHFCCC